MALQQYQTPLIQTNRTTYCRCGRRMHLHNGFDKRKMSDHDLLISCVQFNSYESEYSRIFASSMFFFYSMQLPLILKTSMQVNLFRIVLSFPLQAFEKYCSFSKNPTRGGGRFRKYRRLLQYIVSTDQRRRFV